MRDEEYDDMYISVIVKAAWKIVNVISIILYLLDITFHYSEVSFILVILSVLVIASVLLIVFNYKSAYAIALNILLFVIYNIFILYKSWTDSSNVFITSK